MTSKPIKVLLEMRPALHGHAGIPQETRLLFRGLALLKELQVEGLIQHNGRLLAAGLPTGPSRRAKLLSKDEQINRLGNVVISLEQSFWNSLLRTILHTAAMALGKVFGGRIELSRFDATHLQDYIWHRFFSKTLPPEDFGIVTRAGYRIVRIPWEAMQICALVTRFIGVSLFGRLDTRDFDVLIAETPYPALVTRNTHLVIRYHDAIPLVMPHTISDRHYHHAWHYYALLSNVRSGAWFVCVSEATRKDLLSIFPEVEQRAITIHNMVSHHYFDESSDCRLVPEIIRTRLNTKIRPPLDVGHVRKLLDDYGQGKMMQYLLMVATIEPRKNHLALLGAWERIRVEQFPELKLLIVGTPGWHCEGIVEKFHPWLERADVFLLHDIPSSELRLLYKHARATICPSFGEGFDFAGVEAMISGGAVVASDIPVHREVYDDAAEFFNPYSGEDFRAAILRVITTEGSARRAELVERGAVVARRYGHDAILPQWQEFLRRLVSPVN